MEKEIKARYRNKLSKIIIEVWNGEKWLYVKTLSDPLKEFQAECLAKVSLNAGQNKEKGSQKFTYDTLSEPHNKDTIAPLDVRKELNKLMGDILK